MDKGFAMICYFGNKKVVLTSMTPTPSSSIRNLFNCIHLPPNIFYSDKNAGATTMTITTPSMRNIGIRSFVDASSPFLSARSFL